LFRLSTYHVASILSLLHHRWMFIISCCPGSALLIEFHQIAQPISFHLCAGLEIDRSHLLAVD